MAGSTDARLARAFIVAAPLARVAGLLPAEERGKRVARSLAAMQPGPRLVARHLVLRAAARPPGLGDAALFLHDDGGSPAEVVLIELSPARREPRRGAPPEVAGEHFTASAYALLPEGVDETVVRAGMVRALDAVFPFRERHLVHRAEPPAAPHLLRLKATASLGVGGLPVRGPWKNAFLASGEVLPGLGLEGELFAGLQAAAHVGAYLGVKGRPR